MVGRKIDRALAKLASLKRSQSEAGDSRIFPGYYAPVIVSEGGQRMIKPMRYRCRLAGKLASYDQPYPGIYNARRDSLEGLWVPAFGHTHALLVVDTFYENVQGPVGKSLVVQFTPRTREPMLVACLWPHWEDPAGREPDLLSFAAITDDPAPEVAAAGRGRTILSKAGTRSFSISGSQQMRQMSWWSKLFGNHRRDKRRHQRLIGFVDSLHLPQPSQRCRLRSPVLRAAPICSNR